MMTMMTQIKLRPVDLQNNQFIIALSFFEIQSTDIVTDSGIVTIDDLFYVRIDCVSVCF